MDVWMNEWYKFFVLGLTVKGVILNKCFFWLPLDHYPDNCQSKCPTHLFSRLTEGVCNDNSRCSAWHMFYKA